MDVVRIGNGALAVIASGVALSAQAFTWTQVATTGPSPRTGHAMAFDSQRGRTVLYGGSTAPPNSSPSAETWEWDGQAWSIVSTAGPGPRTGHVMAYDRQRGLTVLFGGSNGTNIVPETWGWNGNAWSLLATSGPGPIAGYAMAHDHLRGRTVLYGGNTGSAPLGEIWEWDGATWRQVMFASGPIPRSNAALAFDGRRGAVVLFGGYDPAGMYLNDTWQWDGSAWTGMPVVLAPSGRDRHAMACDEHGLTVMFGGGINTFGLFLDGWEWNGAAWRTIPRGPPGRWSTRMVHDSVRGRFVLFGGWYGFSALLGDTWEYTAGGTADVYGAGCGSPPLGLLPVPSAPPLLGTTGEAAIENVPSSLTNVALGWRRDMIGPFTLPMNLVGFGLPGCELWQSSEAAYLPTTPTGPGTARFQLAIPNLPSAIGVNVYLQAWAFAPGANPGNTIVSNGLHWVVGNH